MFLLDNGHALVLVTIFANNQVGEPAPLVTEKMTIPLESMPNAAFRPFPSNRPTPPSSVPVAPPTPDRKPAPALAPPMIPPVTRGIDKVCRGVPSIAMKVGIAPEKATRILADKAAQRRRIVAGAVVIEAGTVVLPARQLEGV